MTESRSLRTGLVLLGFCAALGGARPVFADDAAVGRKHAAKANQLAAKNKCKGAVVAFSKAYKLLKDATLLFNRAECYRKMGKNDDALKDYEQFLADMPSAPNRKNVEERIAALKASPKLESAATAAAVPAPAIPAAPVAAPSPAATAAPEEKQEKEPVHRPERWTD
jgi:tetratricopeptide (TPR) repeat protein